MKNYDKLTKYATKFVGKDRAMDLVHDLWIRFNSEGVDILTENKSNRFLYVTVKNYFGDMMRVKNASIYGNMTAIDESHWVYEPHVFLDVQTLDKVIRDHIQSYIDTKLQTYSSGQLFNKSKPYGILKLIETYEMLCLGLEPEEISKIMSIPAPTIRNYKKKIIEICSFLKPNEGRKR